ncbi:hypothetical protein QT999_15660 [Microcoleus sp. S36b_A2]|uniref:hypothetical protein n=1 Tax=Microcoleus sp. S36bC1 TaxID=2818945 RepID=UPI002FD50ED6
MALQVYGLEPGEAAWMLSLLRSIDRNIEISGLVGDRARRFLPHTRITANLPDLIFSDSYSKILAV